MTDKLTRRGLFRALGAPVSGPTAGSEASVMVARIGQACVELRGVACRRCGEACDASAIRFRPMLGGRYQPLLDTARCTGCGECGKVCPVEAFTLEPVERAALVSGLVELGRSA